MKKRLVLLFGLLLLLAGCANVQEPETTATEETLPPGYYVPASAVETQTDGAVREYALPKDTYTELSAVGDQLVVIAAGEKTELNVLTGIEGIPTATKTLSVAGQPLYNGYGYFDSEKKQVVFLDAQLHETQRLQLPDGMQGQPVIAPDGETVFYCVGGEIHALQMTQQISRMIKSHSYPEQTLTGCYFEGAVIACQTEPGKTLYISTQTGQTLYDKGELAALYTYEEQFVALHNELAVQQVVFGTQTGTPQQLNAEEQCFADALQLGGVLGWQVSDNGALTLQFYDLAAGKKTAAITLENTAAPRSICQDRWGSCVWILCQDGKTLLRWDLKASAVKDAESCIGPLYTAESPDTAGLEACVERAKSFEKTYGIILRVWDDATTTGGDYTLQAEYRPDIIQQQMDVLEELLASFPQKFLKECAKGKIRVCLVRSVNEEQKSAHYWHSKKAYMALSTGTDLQSEFLRCLGYFVDSHVLGNSAKYDYWYKENPEDFVYGAEAQNPEYLAPETRYFTSENAMKSSTEDRSELFWQAMLPDNEAMFQSPYMQSKLTTLCKAIRHAWGTRKEEATFPWEQYLAEPVAYKK